MYKVLKLNAISPLADKVFSGYEYSDSVENPDGIMVRSAELAGYKVNDNLLAVARAGAGTNNIPSADYAEKGIVVFNTPGANANAVKELVICELFLGGRKITEAIDFVKTLKGQAELNKLVEKGKSKFAGGEIYGKTLGVVGLGAIGTLVANAAYALGMKVICVDPYLTVRNAISLAAGIDVVATREELYKAADFITLHVPLNPDTRGMIDKSAIEKMKDGVVIINDSRGELAVADDVREALESGKIGRYITDFPDDKLIGAKNAVCLPHLGASTPEAEDNCALMAAKQLADYIENGNITNGVNYPSVAMPKSSVARVCVHHRNVKDILAKILKIISSRSINVANMLDKSKGEYAYLILDLDDVPDEKCVEEIAAVDGVLRARAI